MNSWRSPILDVVTITGLVQVVTQRIGELVPIYDQMMLYCAGCAIQFGEIS